MFINLCLWIKKKEPIATHIFSIFITAFNDKIFCNIWWEIVKLNNVAIIAQGLASTAAADNATIEDQYICEANLEDK